MEYYIDVTYFAPKYGYYKMFNGQGNDITGVYIEETQEISLSNYLYLDKGETTIRYYFNTDMVPNGLFEGTNVKTLSFGEDMKEVGIHAFSNCYYLENLYLESIEIIGENAFSNNRNLEELQLLPPLKIVNHCAFSGNISLKKLYIIKGNNKKICKKAFSKCYLLNEIIFAGYEENDKIEVEKLAFNECRKLIKHIDYISKYLLNVNEKKIKQIFYTWFYYNRKILRKKY